MQAAATDHLEELNPLTYLPLVGHVVHQLAARYPRSVDRTAMWNAGAAGLLYAIRRADRAGLMFSQHAIRVIRASVLDTIDVTTQKAPPVSDAVLAESLEITADQLATIRETQLTPATTATTAAPAPQSAGSSPRQPVSTRTGAPRWTAAAAAAYR